MDTPAPSPAAETLNRDGLWAMPAGPPHEEMHVARNAVVHDLVIGAADGLTLPFALAAGLSGAGAANPLVVTAGLAVIAAGGIARSLRGYLDARNEADHYLAERGREEEETVEYADRERWEVAAILHRYGVRGDALRLSVDSICADQRRWVDFMMRFELDLKEPEPQRAAQAALTTGFASVAGGLVPLAPFILVTGTSTALAISAGVTGIAMAGLGRLRSCATGLPALRGAVQAVMIGAGAAVAAALVARAVTG